MFSLSVVSDLVSFLPFVAISTEYASFPNLFSVAMFLAIDLFFFFLVCIHR